MVVKGEEVSVKVRDMEKEGSDMEVGKWVRKRYSDDEEDKLSENESEDESSRKSKKRLSSSHSSSEKVKEGEEEEEEEPESFTCKCLRISGIVFGASFLSLTILTIVGILLDYVVWERVGEFYSWSLPVVGLISVLLFALLVIIDKLFPFSWGKQVYEFFVYVFLFLFAHFAIAMYLNTWFGIPNHEFYMNKQLHNLLAGNSYRTQNSANELKSLYEMDEYDDFYTWLKGPLVENLFCTQTNEVVEGMCLVNDLKLGINQPIRLRTIRSDGFACSRREAVGNVCVVDYTPETEFTSNWALNFDELDKHCPNKFLELENDLAWDDGYYLTFSGKKRKAMTVRGVAGDYHRGGYSILLHPDRLTNLTLIKDCIDYFSEVGFLDRATRVLYFEVSFEGFDLNVWHVLQIQMEFLLSGAIEVRQLQQHGRIPGSKNTRDVLSSFPEGPISACRDVNDTVIPFEDCTNAQPLIVESLMGMLIFYVSFATYICQRIFYDLFSEGPRAFISRGWHFFDMLLVIFLYTGLSLEIGAQTFTPYGTDKWYDYTIRQRDQQAILSVIVLMIWVKLLQFASLGTWTRVITKTMARAVRDILMFLFLFFAVLIGFTLQFYILFGRISFEFSTIDRSFYSMIRALTGDINADELFRYEPTVAFLAYGVFIVVVVFTLLTMLIAIINEHFVESVVAMQNQNAAAASAEQDSQKTVHDDDDASTVTKEVQSKTESRSKWGFEEDDNVTWLKSVQDGYLNLHVLHGTNFSKVDQNKQGIGIDPYLKIYMTSNDGEVRQYHRTNCCTPTLRNSMNPKWNARAALLVESVTDTLIISAYDRSVSGPDVYLGETRVKIKDIEGNATIETLKLSLEDYRSFTSKMFSNYKVHGRVSISVARKRRTKKRASEVTGRDRKSRRRSRKHDE